MNIKGILKQLTPSFIKVKYVISKDNEQLKSIQKIECELDNLQYKKDFSLSNFFESEEIENMWCNSKKNIDSFNIPDGSGGVNPGDRKAIYYLISKLKPSSVLEIGTHIGASTVNIASALYMSQIKDGKNTSLTTVDIVDVNSTVLKPWLEYGTKYSPLEMINKLGYGAFVNFIAATSTNYFANCTQKFDFIFLDGSHAAHIVYQEIPMALKLLNENGIILLHDYFPENKPLWSDGTLIPGPYLATERFKNEGVKFNILPLGELPWPTKLSSSITSLALLLKQN